MGSLTWDSPEFWVLIVLALIVGAAWWKGSRRPRRTHADELMDSYRELDAARLAQVPDEQLVEAVAANLLAKLDPNKPDPLHTIPLLSQGRCAVYGVWTLTEALKRGDLAAYLREPTGAFAELTCNGLSWLGADRCAQALQAACAGADEGEIAAQEPLLREALSEEDPLARCRECIREDPTSFID